MSLKHLDGYLEEFTFRFNRRRAKRITDGADAAPQYGNGNLAPSLLENRRPS